MTIPVFSAVGTEVRRQAGHFPWKQATLAIIVVLLIGITIAVFNTDLFSGKSDPAVQPEQQVNIAPAVVNPAPAENPPAQTEPEIVAPATGLVAWPFVQVEWILVSDLSALPPAEEGFYNGTMENNPYGSGSTAEWGAYARRIVSNRYGFTDDDLQKAVAAISRDQTNKQIVLAGLGLTRGPIIDLEKHQIIKDAQPETRLFLSLDGEKTWMEVNSTPPAFEGAIVLAWETRVTSRNEVILLFARAGGGGARNGYWWTTTLIP